MFDGLPPPPGGGGLLRSLSRFFPAFSGGGNKAVPVIFLNAVFGVLLFFGGLPGVGPRVCKGFGRFWSLGVLGFRFIFYWGVVSGIPGGLALAAFAVL